MPPLTHNPRFERATLTTIAPWTINRLAQYVLWLSNNHIARQTENASAESIDVQRCLSNAVLG